MCGGLTHLTSLRLDIDEQQQHTATWQLCCNGRHWGLSFVKLPGRLLLLCCVSKHGSVLVQEAQALAVC